jgi:hypothetical protein
MPRIERGHRSPLLYKADPPPLAIDLDQSRGRTLSYSFFGNRGLGEDWTVERSAHMDVYQTLLQDHQTIQQIFCDIEKTNVSKAKRRELLFSTLREKLEAHEILEETVFYPEIDKFPIAGELVNAAFEDHAEFDAILQEISELPVDKPEWLERVAELKDLARSMHE